MAPTQKASRSKSGRKEGRPLVIVESPAKARTIGKFLGSGYVVESSIGHVRDLPSTAKEIPPKYKGESWARTGVNVEEDFKPLYIVPAEKKAQVKKLKDLLKEASELYLATDEDREGEAIAWHLSEVLKPKVPVKRMVFHEITASAIQDAIDSPRELDDRLVDAQEARRILDRLYGYEVSPVLWRKIQPRLSAGRVQSVATRLVVDREAERRRFVSGTYWDLEGTFSRPGSEARPFGGTLVELGEKPVATGKDFDAKTGRLTDPGAVTLLDEAEATALNEELGSARFSVATVNEKPFTQRPPAPFITSTLQQEAGRKLRFTAQRTMRAAQSLYENGFITYMRTDSTNLSAQALDASRGQAVELYGADHVPEKPREYKRKVKGAQEAHEAIRPAGDRFRTPDAVSGELESDQAAIYELIWKRTIASQMKDASGLRTQVRIGAETSRGEARFAASGKVIRFAGFLRAYVEGSDDPEAELADQERILPPLAVGDAIDAESLAPRSHATQPPARYTEASLIKELEDRGIGRPSTYAAIIRTIQDRGYVWKKGTALVPTLTAFAVVNLLREHFQELVDYEFTARMEEDLDLMAAGEREARPWLRRFYFGDESAAGEGLDAVGLKRKVGSGWDEIDARAISSLPLGENAEGAPVVARVGRYGPYVQVGDSDERASLPDQLLLDELDVEQALGFIERAAGADRVLGDDPETGKPIYLKSGRFGPYVQLGDPERTEKGTLKKGGKPRMASVWTTMEPETLTLDQALLLLSFPREIGTHPESGEPIIASDGRYGPYIKMGTETRSLEGHDQLATVTVEEAVKILAEPKRRRGQASQRVLNEIGTHPESGAAIHLRSGRFGPYVTDGEVNASVPKGLDPSLVDLERAVDLLAARREKLIEQGKDPAAKTAKKKTSKKKASRKKATKKSAKKKTAKGTTKKAAANDVAPPSAETGS